MSLRENLALSGPFPYVKLGNMGLLEGVSCELRSEATSIRGDAVMGQGTEVCHRLELSPGLGEEKPGLASWPTAVAPQTGGPGGAR